MNATLTIDLSNTSPDAVAEVLRILHGTSGQVNGSNGNGAESADTKGKLKAVKAETKTETINTEVTIEQVRAAVAAKRDTHREKIRTLLTEYGAESVTKLDKTKYAEFLQKVNAL
jgi:hypothetical protein